MPWQRVHPGPRLAIRRHLAKNEFRMGGWRLLRISSKKNSGTIPTESRVDLKPAVTLPKLRAQGSSIGRPPSCAPSSLPPPRATSASAHVTAVPHAEPAYETCKLSLPAAPGIGSTRATAVAAARPITFPFRDRSIFARAARHLPGSSVWNGVLRVQMRDSSSSVLFPRDRVLLASVDRANRPANEQA